MGPTPDADNLSSRERPRRHAAGAIQPHGALLVLDRAGVVIQLAGDTRRALGIAPEALLNNSLGGLSDRNGQVLAAALEDHPAHPAHVTRWHPAAPGEGAWEVIVHADPACTLVEFEPAVPHHPGETQTMAALARVLASLEQAPDLDALGDALADGLRRMAGCDRVLVYRFADDGAGVAVAEARGEALPALLGQRFAGAAVPLQARGRYLRNRFRGIADATATPAPLQPACPTAGAASGIGRSSLRSASPAHRQWLLELGVAASMSFAVVVDDRLWGMVACDHAEAWAMPYPLREACQHAVRAFARQLEALEATRHRHQRASLRALRHAWLGPLRDAVEAGHRLELDPAQLAGLLPCDGAAVVAAGRVTLAGSTPGEAEVARLAEWLGGTRRAEVFATDRLAGQWPAAAAWAAQVSSVMATVAGADEPRLLLWFRATRATPTAPGPDWSRAEIATARQLGRSLTALLQQQAVRALNGRLQEAVAQQQSLVAQKNLLMQEVHHRVQNSLQIVNSMLQLQARQSTDPRVRAPFEGAVHRLMAVSAVHRHLWRSSDAQNVRLEPYLKELCADLMRSWGEGWAGRVTVEAWDVVIPSQTAVTLALLVTELLTNAAKYAYAGAPGPVAVLVGPSDRGGLHVTVRDHGLGLRDKVQGSGLGSRLIRIFSAQLGGQVHTQSGAGGTTVTIVLPLPQRDAAAHTDRTPA